MILEKIASLRGNSYFQTKATSMALAYLFKLQAVSVFPLFVAALLSIY